MYKIVISNCNWLISNTMTFILNLVMVDKYKCSAYLIDVSPKMVILDVIKNIRMCHINK